MKLIGRLLVIVCFIFVSGCSTAFEDIPHYVTGVEDGNTLILKNGLKVHLIGVDGNMQSQEYLEHKVLHRKVKLIFDRSNYPEITRDTEEVWAYVITETGKHLNASMLREGLATMSNTYLTDSLVAFSGYSNITASQTIAERVPESGPLRERSFTPSLPAPETKTAFKNFVDLVEYAEQCVFLVLGRNDKGRTVSQGTGFFIEENGLGVSNHHVFEGGVEWMIRTKNGNRYKVTEIIESNKEFDYIIFRVDLGEAENFPYLQAAEQTPRKGTDIFVLGNPRGLESTITRGVVSAIRDQGGESAVIQIDAAISPGSSGSPVINMDGRVVGVATYKARDCESCNFAMNIKLLGF
jgi:serine protease Do